jgi:capsular polysaccharide biosynthesis protein
MENINKEKPEEIDLAEILKSLWNRRRFIARFAGVVVLLGLIVAIFSPIEYTSTTTIIPQSDKASGSNLQGLAAMAGIDLSADQHNELLSPMVYPMVVSSVPFQKELMHSKITIGGHDKPIALIDYYTKKGYQKFSLISFLKKYTLGLPGVIVTAFAHRGDSDTQVDSLSQGNIEILTEDENKCMTILTEQIAVNIDSKNGYISLSATMPEALMSAQVAARVQELLQEYVTRFKLQKAQTNLDFIEARYQEVKINFETKQRALAAFQDANRDISSAVARTRENRLSNEYNLAFSIYSEMARQREQASIKVKEDTPIFTVVKPVTLPMEKSAPRRGFILAVSLILGLLIGAGLALILPFMKETFDIKWPKKRHRRTKKEHSE